MRSSGAKSPPHVVVIGNQKGGSGKSTFAMHIIIALLKAGKRVASFDLDLNQLTLTRYLTSGIDVNGFKSTSRNWSCPIIIRLGKRCMSQP